MDYIITGKIDRPNNRIHYASGRLKKCQGILESRGLTFPPLYLGTLNIRCDKEFPTPDWSNIIFISSEEMKMVDPDFTREWWKLILVKKVNGHTMHAFILRTETNFHGDNVIELIAPDLSNSNIVDLTHDSKIELLLSDNKRPERENLSGLVLGLVNVMPL